MASIRKVGKKWLAEVRLKTGYASKRFETKLEARAYKTIEKKFYCDSIGKKKVGIKTIPTASERPRYSPRHRRRSGSPNPLTIIISNLW